jgi:hypothetical protein
MAHVQLATEPSQHNGTIPVGKQPREKTALPLEGSLKLTSDPKLSDFSCIFLAFLWQWLA